MKKLIAIDGNSLLYRAYFALPNMTTRDGRPTGALYGFLTMLLKLIESKPDYLLVAFDLHGPTFRHKKYEQYKAGRPETPQDLRAQFPMLKSILREMGIAVCECEGYEADDILGTFAVRCQDSGIDALLVTGDRDALQLVSDSTHVLITKKGLSDTLEYTPALLQEKFSLTPRQMIDLKSLMGDSSDNIPGIPGVGEKTALKLLAEYQTLDGVLANADAIAGKLGEKIRSNADLAHLSYWLGTICTEAPVASAIAECAFSPETVAQAKQMLQDLELRSITAKLPDPQELPRQISAVEVVVFPVSDLTDLQEILKEQKEAKLVAITCTERISFAFSEGVAYQIENSDDLFGSALEEREILKAFAPLLQSGVTLITFDSKKLRHVLSTYDVPFPKECFDCMIADYLLNANRSASTLAELCEQRLHATVPNAAHLFALQPIMTQELQRKNLWKLYTEIELPLAQVLFDMEAEGFRIDETVLSELSISFGQRTKQLEAEIYMLAGESFNILSPKQLGVILFEKLELPTKRKTKTGYSTDAETLETLADAHPIVPLITEYRFLTKLKSTFIDGLLHARSSIDGRVRTQFNQCVTATGRISSTEPNLQNIPVRSELGREIRKAFIASEGCKLVGADYSQIELRLLAHMSADDSMIHAFEQQYDIHRATAGEVFGVAYAQVTDQMRSAAKAVNFGIVYGISDFGLSKNLGIPVKEAGAYIKTYFERYPSVHTFLEKCKQDGKENGYAVTMFGRRRDLPELKSGNFNTRSFGERVAMNMPIQGTAADIIKLAMVHVCEAIRAKHLKAKLILQVHDELILDTPLAEVEQVAALVKDAMEHVCPLKVPLIADVKVGNSWYETK